MSAIFLEAQVSLGATLIAESLRWDMGQVWVSSPEKNLVY